VLKPTNDNFIVAAPGCRLPSRDWCTEDGANALAAKIRAFWLRRGVNITTHIERFGEPGSASELFCLRSNIDVRRPA
jgi:hypothetical protein